MQKRFTNASRTPQSSAQFMAVVSRFQRTLNDFTGSLPELLNSSAASVEAHLHRPDRAAYITLHTWFGITHIELYRFALSHLRDPTAPTYCPDVPREFMLSSRQQAVAYAVSLAQLWKHHIDMVLECSVPEKGLVTIDWMVGAWFVEVATILLMARKHRLWHNLVQGSSAYLCRRKPIDDDLLASLLSSMCGIVSASRRPPFPSCHGLGKPREHTPDTT
jgi:hypothetical protein